MIIVLVYVCATSYNIIYYFGHVMVGYYFNLSPSNNMAMESATPTVLPM